MREPFCGECQDGAEYRAYWAAYDAEESARKEGFRSALHLGSEPEASCDECPSCVCGRLVREHSAEEREALEARYGYWHLPHCFSFEEEEAAS